MHPTKNAETYNLENNTTYNITIIYIFKEHGKLHDLPELLNSDITSLIQIKDKTISSSNCNTRP